MLGVKQMSRSVRSAAPVVLNRAVREMVIHLARVHCTAFEDEFHQDLRLSPLCSGPGETTCGRDVDIRTRMHQRLQGSSHEAVVNEDVLLDAERRVAAFEIAGPERGSDRFAQNRARRERVSA